MGLEIEGDIEYAKHKFYTSSGQAEQTEVIDILATYMVNRQ
jgi:hypothetical protein